METIDVTPTWSDLLPALLAVVEAGNGEGRKIARTELGRMAQAADLFNRRQPLNFHAPTDQWSEVSVHPCKFEDREKKSIVRTTDTEAEFWTVYVITAVSQLEMAIADFADKNEARGFAVTLISLAQNHRSVR